LWLKSLTLIARKIERGGHQRLDQEDSSSMKRFDVQRLPVFLAWSALTVLFGCDGEKLAPVSKFNSADCQKHAENCSDGNLHLDGGKPGGGGGDSGAPIDTDAGASVDANSPDFDAASGVDASSPDATTAVDSGPAPSQFLNLNGTWHTRYSFDLSHYLFGISGIAPTIDFINQVLMGHLNTGIPGLDQLILGVVQQYVPSWVAPLVNALDTIANLFSDVRANGGLLTITQDPPLHPTDPTTAIHATETWTEMVVMIIDQCPGGQQDPNYPTCAEHHIPVTHNPQNVGPLEILVTLPGFDGTLNAGVPQADFVFTQREVQMEMRKLILLVIDTVVSIVTPYMNLHDALSNVIDCNGLGQQAVNFVENTLGLSPLVAIPAGVLVTHQCNSAINDIVNGIGNIGINWEAMDFDQHGHAVDSNGDGRPEVLQQWSVPNTISGHFRFAIQSSMSGQWEGLP
jgi:hypothetical protein